MYICIDIIARIFSESMSIGFGIIGTGRISDWILKGAVRDSRFRAVAVCSRKEESARSFIERHPEAFISGAKAYASIEEMLVDPLVEAVYIGTPNSTHHGYAMAAMEAGKHVLCEKPAACNASELSEMIAKSREKGCCFMEAMVSTLNPNFRIARELMEKIGPVWHYNSSFCQYSSKYEALREGIVPNSFNPRMGGGALADVGIYTTYPAVALFGRPQSVKSNLVRFATEFGDTDVHGTVELAYPGMTAVLSFSKVVDSHSPTEICGEGGNILLDEIHICRRVEYAPHAAPASGRGPASEHELVCKGLPEDEYYYEFKEFMDVCEAGGIESAVNSHEVSLINRELMDDIARA